MTSSGSSSCHLGENDDRNRYYFDATPEPSVCDWEMPQLNDAIFFMPTPQYVDGEHVATTVKKSRPPKFVRELQTLQACLTDTQRALEASNNAVYDALSQKADKIEVAAVSENLLEKVDSVIFEEELGKKASQRSLEDNLTCKADRKEFDELRYLGNALQDGLDLISYNMSGKADRSSVQAALAQKVSHAEAASSFAEKTSHDILSARVRCCIALWGFFVMICILLFSVVIYVLLQQHYHIQELSHANHDLTHTVEELSLQKQRSKDEWFSSLPLLAAGEDRPDEMQYVSVSEFHSNQVHEDGYSIELKPPCKNAWVNVEASFRSGRTLCRGRVDVILRSDHNIFGLLPETEETLLTETKTSIDTLIDANEKDANVSCNAQGKTGAISVASTTTSTTSRPCMVITATMKLKHDGTIVPSLNVKQSGSLDAEANENHIYEVSGKIQWNRQ